MVLACVPRPCIGRPLGVARKRFRPAYAAACVICRNRWLRRVVFRQTRVPLPSVDRAGYRRVAIVVTGLSLASLVLAGVATPAILFAILAIASLGKRPLPERWTGRLAASLMLLSCSALIIAIVVHGV